MKKNVSRFSGLFIFLTAFAAFFSCNKSSEFGSDLLADDILNVGVITDFDLSGYTRLIDSVRTFDLLSSLQDSVFLVGDIDDPIFGRTRSSLYFRMRPTRIIDDLNPDAVRFDSIVLRLAVDPNTFYGDTLLPVTIRFHQLQELLPEDSVFYSNRDYAVKPMPLAVIDNYVFTPRTFVEIIDTTKDPPDTSRIKSNIEIKLDEAFGQSFLQDPEIFKSTANFLEFFKGIYMEIEGPGPIVGINLLDPLTSLRLFYTEEEVSKTIVMNITSGVLKCNSFKHNQSVGSIGEFIENELKGDSLLFIQGLAGPRPVLKFNDLSKLEGKSLKLAELEFFIAELPGDNIKIYPLPTQFLLSTHKADRSFTLIDELNVFINSGRLSEFDGRITTDVIDGVKVKKVRMNITNHLQRILLGIEPNEVIVSILGSSKRPNRAVFYGPGHSKYPVRLKLVATDL
jgi:hypothetical protein